MSESLHQTSTRLFVFASRVSFRLAMREPRLRPLVFFDFALNSTESLGSVAVSESFIHTVRFV